MARYIDADKIDYMVTMVGMDEFAGYRAVAFESDIDAMPTADVVPKSEVARLTIDMNAARLGMIVEHERLKTARADVAREIFESLEAISGRKDGLIVYADEYIKLKKKYTEE